MYLLCAGAAGAEAWTLWIFRDRCERRGEVLDGWSAGPVVVGMSAGGMLQQGGVGGKPSVGAARFSGSHFLPLGSGSSGSWALGRPAKSGSLSSISSGSDSLDTAGADPDHILQLVNDVRRFADVLLRLKEALSCTGEPRP